MHTTAITQNCVHPKFSPQKLSICIFLACRPTFDGTRTLSQVLLIILITVLLSMVRTLNIKSNLLCLDYCVRRRSGKDLKTRSQGTFLWKRAALLLPAALGLPYPTYHYNTCKYRFIQNTHTHKHTDTDTHIHTRAKYCWVHCLSCMQFGRVWSDILVRSDWYAASDDQTLSHKNNSFHCKLVHCGTMWQILVYLIYLWRPK